MRTPGGSLGRPLKGCPQRSSCEPFTASTFQALRAPTPCTPPVGGAGWGGGGVEWWMGLPVRSLAHGAHLFGRGGPPAGLPCRSQIPTYSLFGVRPLSARGGTSITMCRPTVSVRGHAGVLSVPMAPSIPPTHVCTILHTGLLKQHKPIRNWSEDVMAVLGTLSATAGGRGGGGLQKRGLG